MGEMHEKSDIQLLREYAETGEEAAFRELVTRHTDFGRNKTGAMENAPFQVTPGSSHGGPLQFLSDLGHGG